MADIKENEMPIASAQYLRGIGYDGSSVNVKNIMTTIDRQTIEIDCNEMRSEERFSAYRWKNAPTVTNIGILEIFRYSNDWFVQKFYLIGADAAVYIRCWYNGNTWSNWRRI